MKSKIPTASILFALTFLFIGSNASAQDEFLKYNPEVSLVSGAKATAATMKAALPGAIPWPANAIPTPKPLAKAPGESDDLSKFKGYDAIVITWTSAEAATLASLFTPGYRTSDWYEYRHNVNNYIPLVTGAKAPFNDRSPRDARYYHSLGLYFPCVIGGAKVLVFKSGLHLDYDGPATPVQKLIDELVTVIHPKILITTGTGGGIGKGVLLGDVIIAGITKFDCKKQFKDKPWHSASYKTTKLPAGVVASITPSLTEGNAAKIPNARKNPKFWSDPTAAIVTTDFFAFDDSTNGDQLQGLGQACDMGDAMVGMAMQNHPDVMWFAVRNASDPQIPNPNNDMKAASKEAGDIYQKYGAFTTAASVVATWAIINTIINSKK